MNGPGWRSSSRTSRSPSTAGSGWSASRSWRRGYDVTVVCPQGEGTGPDAGHRRRADPRLPPGTRPAGSALGYVVEYAWSFLATARLVRAARREGPFDALQACNPPDIFWPIARWLRRRDGTRFVFDHHDLCPELYLSRFDGSTGAPLQGPALPRARRPSGPPTRSPRRTSRTPRSPRAAAGRPPTTSRVVRTGPDPQRLQRREPVARLRRGRNHLVAYLGVMGPQDGVDLALGAADVVVNRLGRDDIAFTFMGVRRLLRRPRRAGATSSASRTPSTCPGRVPDELRRRGAVHRRRRAVPGPAQPAQRRLDDEQDDGVHGLRPAGRGLRPARDAGVGRRRRPLRASPTTSRSTPSAIVALARRPGEAHGDGPPRARRGSSTSWPGSTSARATCASSTSWWGTCPTGHHSGRGGLTCAGSPGRSSSPTGRCSSRPWSSGSRTAGRMPARSSSWSTPTPRSSWATARLSIIDLSSAADQPFAKGGLTLTYNGELYNYRELRRRARTLGAPVRHGIRHRGRPRGLARLGIRRRCRGSAGCSPSRSTTSAPATSPWPATPSASSRST